MLRPLLSHRSALRVIGRYASRPSTRAFRSMRLPLGRTALALHGTVTSPVPDALCQARRLAHTFTFTSPHGLAEWFQSCTVRQSNVFAQSRVTNYLKRVVDPDSSATLPTLFATLRVHASPPIFQTTLKLPVDVLVENQVTRCDVQARGFGADARSARAACCMHAERCLDSLGVPLFASPQRQEEHAKEAHRDGGRYAPQHGDLPSELSAVTLPPPFIAASPLFAIFTPPASAGQSLPAASASDAACHGTGAPPARRAIRFDHHYGPDPFIHRVEAELDGLRAAILTLQTTAMAAAEDGGEEEPDGDGDADARDPPVIIEASEVAVLQPDGTTFSPHKDDEDNTDTNTAAGTRLRSRSPPLPLRLPRVGVAYSPSRAVSEHHCPARLPVDESEGDRFDLVEGISGDGWQTQREVPSATCIYDPHARPRIEAYYRALADTSALATLDRFEDSLTLTTSEEATNVRTGRGTWRAAPMTWWTASTPVPNYEAVAYQHAPLRAIGKATTAEAATVLCAMHMELLLGFLGEPVQHESTAAQWQYYDACLCWGRPVAPVPWLTPTTDLSTHGCVPRPMKEWFRPDRDRLRHAPLTVTEKLLALNRAIVTECRQHLIEVDLFDHPRCAQDGYTELLELATPCVRAFLRAQRHPYEGAYFVYVFTKDSEYRATLYLPLPARYGVRGAYAVASTPARARALCALHAVDILCSLGVIPVVYDPPAEDGTWRRLLELREKLGLTVPSTRARASAVNPQLRTPPAYRESPGRATTMIAPAEAVWRTMLLDASWFDVVPDGKDLQLTMVPGEKLLFADVLSAGRHLFLAYVQATAGWARDDMVHALHHYCGRQHCRGHRRRVANTYWMRLPIDAAQYGPRVAIGRCITRKGAERNFYIHAFRILATLDLVPWMTQSAAELQKSVYGGDATRASSDMRLWKAFAPHVIDPAAPSRATASRAAVDAILTETGDRLPAQDMRAVPSPHPVMSYELARGTL